MPSFEKARPNKSKKKPEKEIRNQRRKMPFVDRYPWDEADTKIKNLLYLSIGTEASRIYHQHNPHTKIDTCTTYELAHELSITFTKSRKTPYDRFLIINARQEPHETLETFIVDRDNWEQKRHSEQ